MQLTDANSHTLNGLSDFGKILEASQEKPVLGVGWESDETDSSGVGVCVEWRHDRNGEVFDALQVVADRAARVEKKNQVKATGSYKVVKKIYLIRIINIRDG